MTRIIYTCNTRLPTEKAHGLSTVKLCEALVEAGNEVDLIVPKMWRKSDKDLFEYYGVKRNFRVHFVPCIDILHLFHVPFLEPVTFLIQIFTFSIASVFFILRTYNKADRNDGVFFSHDYMPLYFASMISPKFYYDIHHFPGRNFMYRRLMHKGLGFAVQTRWKVDELVQKWHIPREKIVYWPNGTDISRFQKKISTNEARTYLDLPTEMEMVVYTGQLFAWKGVDTLVLAAKHCPNSQFYIVGGSEYDAKQLRGRMPRPVSQNVHFIANRPYEEMVWWQKAADVLVLPNTAKYKVSAYYTSPMKLFEYMASGRAILASDIPSVREIVSDKNAVLVAPDDEVAMAQGISALFADSKTREQLGKTSLHDSTQYSWLARAQEITAHIHGLK